MTSVITKKNVDASSSLELRSNRESKKFYSTYQNHQLRKATKKAISQNDSFWFEDDQSESSFIQKYFQLSPDERVKIRAFVSQRVTTIAGIKEILILGNAKGIKDNYDAAVSLLAECKDRLLSQVMLLGHYPIPLGGDISLLSTEQWEILIKATACSLTLSPDKKLMLLLGLLNNCEFWNRLVKAAIIDAFVNIEDEIDAEIIQPYLECFISSREKDDYIRDYARDALEDIS